jgi:salicylate hydroxylase
MRVAVIGGGIGGLSAALAMLKAGCDVHVYEQALKFGEIGAGIQIAPNASRLLQRLGLGAALDAWGVRPGAVHQRRWDDGRTLQRRRWGQRSRRSAPTTISTAAISRRCWPRAAPSAHASHRLAGIEEKNGRAIAR